MYSTAVCIVCVFTWKKFSTFTDVDVRAYIFESAWPVKGWDSVAGACIFIFKCASYIYIWHVRAFESAAYIYLSLHDLPIKGLGGGCSDHAQSSCSAGGHAHALGGWASGRRRSQPRYPAYRTDNTGCEARGGEACHIASIAGRVTISHRAACCDWTPSDHARAQESNCTNDEERERFHPASKRLKTAQTN